MTPAVAWTDVPRRIVIIDETHLVRGGLRLLIGGRADHEIVAEAETPEGLPALPAAVPHVLILGVDPVGRNGLPVIATLKSSHPAARVLVLSMQGEVAYVRTALDFGASGYLHKRCTDSLLFAAIDAVAEGRIFVDPSIADGLFVSRHAPHRSALTGRERQVLSFIARGYATKEIAGHLDISGKTVESHRARISAKLGLPGRAALVRFAFAAGLVTLGDMSQEA